MVALDDIINNPDNSVPLVKLAWKSEDVAVKVSEYEVPLTYGGKIYPPNYVDPLFTYYTSICE